ncbi:MAG: hypothetical protein ACP5NZ_03280 [Nanobdellota archaeon]
MENNLIYIQNARVLILEKYKELFKTNFLGRNIDIKEVKELGKIFPIEVKQLLKDRISIKDKLEEMFQIIPNSNPLTSSLEYYLSKAEIPFTLAKKESGKIQYLGLDYQDSINLEGVAKKSIIPCQFYLIKDNLMLDQYFKKISQVSESSPTIFPSSDEKPQEPISEKTHLQATCYL